MNKVTRASYWVNLSCVCVCVCVCVKDTSKAPSWSAELVPMLSVYVSAVGVFVGANEALLLWLCWAVCWLCCCVCICMFGAPCYCSDLQMWVAAATSIRLGQEEPARPEVHRVWKSLTEHNVAKTLPNFAYAEELPLFLKALVLVTVQVRHRTTWPSGLTIYTNFFLKTSYVKKNSS